MYFFLGASLFRLTDLYSPLYHGCTHLVLLPSHEWTKLCSCYAMYIFFGHNPKHKGYRFYDPNCLLTLFLMMLSLLSTFLILLELLPMILSLSFHDFLIFPFLISALHLHHCLQRAFLSLVWRLHFKTHLILHHVCATYYQSLYSHGSSAAFLNGCQPLSCSFYGPTSSCTSKWSCSYYETLSYSGASSSSVLHLCYHHSFSWASHFSCNHLLSSGAQVVSLDNHYIWVATHHVWGAYRFTADR